MRVYGVLPGAMQGDVQVSGPCQAPPADAMPWRFASNYHFAFWPSVALTVTLRTASSG
jgi:hypothetical protein